MKFLYWLEGKLVDGWKSAWKWVSVQFMALALLLESYAELVKIGWASYPDTLKGDLPHWISPLVALLILAGLIGRLFRQKSP